MREFYFLFPVLIHSNFSHPSLPLATVKSLMLCKITDIILEEAIYADL